MTQYAPFVGRRDEQSSFQQLLSDASQQGLAVLVVGPPGFGKTSLLDRFTQLAANHPDLRCGVARYELTPTDSPDATLALMLDHAYEAANVTEGSFEPTDRRIKQWKAILNVFKIGDLALSLRRDPAKNSRDQFLDRIHRISPKMPQNARAIFIIDPEKYLMPNSHDAWRLVVQNLPPKIIFVFAQRSDDCLVNSPDFLTLDNLIRIPEDSLDILDQTSVSELIDLYASDINIPAQKLESTLTPYRGHPYAVHAALLLLKDGLPRADGPPDPQGLAATQFRQNCAQDPKAGRLFKAYALLEVAVPDDVVQAVSDLSMDDIQCLLAQTDLPGYLRFETAGRRIYHALLADFIKSKLSETEASQYHRRAIEKYRSLLQDDTKPSPLAAARLPEHVLATEDYENFVSAIVNECAPKLFHYGLYDVVESYVQHALQNASPDSEEVSVLLPVLAFIYKDRGDLDRAEDMHQKVLKINLKLGDLKGQASQYGNLGNVYHSRGELGRAEEMYKKSLEIHDNLDDIESKAIDYSHLGLINFARGQLGLAENMLNKALEINQHLDKFESQASDFGNLGIIYQTRGDLDRAEEMFNKVLEIEERLGHIKSISKAYGNLGIIYEARGELDRAEDMHKKSLKIDLKLGSLEGQAADYGNLGVVYQSRGDLKQTRSFWLQARQLFQQIGMPHKVKQINDWLNDLPPESPD